MVGWGKNHTLEFVQVDTGKLISKISYEGDVIISKISPDGNLFLLATETRGRGAPVANTHVKLQLISVKTGQVLSLLPGHKRMLWDGAAFSPDGKRIVTVGYGDKLVRVWDVATKRELYQFDKGDDGMWRVAVSPDGKMLVAATLRPKPIIRQWNLVTGKEQRSLDGKVVQEKHESAVFAMQFLPDGKTLITTDAYGRMFFWDTLTGKLRLEVKAHGHCVQSLSISSDGKTLLTKDSTCALVWDVPALLRRAR
jgi:WD40 repeat protein